MNKTKLLNITTFLVLIAWSMPVFQTPYAMAETPNELVFVFQKQKDPAEMRAHSQEVATFLAEHIGIPVRAQVPSDYSASVQALVSGKADIAYLDSLGFLLARRDGNASLLLAEERVDSRGVARTSYDSVFVARADSAFDSFEDIRDRAADLRMVFTSSTSTSGYIMPYRRFVSEGLIPAGGDPRSTFARVNFAGSYKQALEQVIEGRGDICAVSEYTMEGEAAANYLAPEQRSQLKVFARTSDVPTHLVAARGGLSQEVLDRITSALLALGSEKPELLSDIYGASKLVKVNENDHVRASIEAVEYIGLPIEGLMRQ